jgi:hypothetical protein
MVQVHTPDISASTSAFRVGPQERSDLSHLRAGITQHVSDIIQPPREFHLAKSALIDRLLLNKALFPETTLGHGTTRESRILNV